MCMCVCVCFPPGTHVHGKWKMLIHCLRQNENYAIRIAIEHLLGEDFGSIQYRIKQ